MAFLLKLGQWIPQEGIYSSQISTIDSVGPCKPHNIDGLEGPRALQCVSSRARKQSQKISWNEIYKQAACTVHRSMVMNFTLSQR